MRSASFPAKRFILHHVMPLDTALFRSGSSPATAARLVRSRDDRPPQGMARWGRLLVLVAGLAATRAAAFGEQSPSAAAVLPSPGRLPVGLRAAARHAADESEAAASLDEIALARQLVDRLEERQRQSTRTWLVAADERSPAGSGDPTAASLLLPLDSLTAQLRRQLAAALSRQFHEETVVQAEVAVAAAHRDRPRLLELARAAPSGVAACQALLAAGDVAWERGWPSAAEEAWRQAETTARLMDRSAIIEDACRRQAAAADARVLGLACGEPSRSEDDTMPPEAELPPGPLSLRWQHPLPQGPWKKPAMALSYSSDVSRGRGPVPHSANHDAAVFAVRPRLTSTADGTAPLVCWHAQGGVHARRLADAAVPWSSSATGPVSDRLFPPVGDKTITPAWAPCVQAGRLLSLAGMPAAQRLVCLDISDAAEGRLLWTARLSKEDGGEVGEPVCSLNGRGEALAFVCVRGAETELMAIRLADGQLLWRLPLDGLWPQASSPRAPAVAVAEDLVIVLADDGSVWAVDQAGSLVWARGPAASAPAPTVAAGRPALQAPAVACGTLVFCSPDGRQLTALGLRSGRVLWQFFAPARLSLVGLTGSELVAFEDGRIMSLSLTDGSILASRPTPDLPLAGDPLLADGLLFWPVASQATTTDSLPSPAAASLGGQVLILTPATLAAAAPPLALGRGPARSVSLAASDGQLVVCDDASIQVFGVTAAD